MSLKETKDAYIGKLKLQLDEWSADLDAIEAKARQADVEFKEKYQAKAEELRYQKTLAQGRINALQEAADDAWEELRNGSESIWGTVRQTFADAKAKFANK
ncbi:MAG: hypothetical protein AW10_00657 [Candidatus Accumulibacter appositus]|uniref:Coiled coil domain-containing protein n=1 Tax=Candidatus Accumulibacter appositus TaxID=1454003 RepID=A0A011PZ96_9PROT|nr:hypothetical protein [Accumulibacter sp.]EXI82210.1 MAG: hypothetical protein AW10_00657 [Candidatus Accumulibacter appositus]HRF04457.1 hypothetical protein [Accumulibacter sp.]